MPYIREVRRDVRKITEMKDGCIYKTKSLGYIWIPLNEVTTNPNESFQEFCKRSKEYEKKIAQEHGGDFLCSVPTSFSFEETCRSRKVE